MAGVDGWKCFSSSVWGEVINVITRIKLCCRAGFVREDANKSAVVSF